MVSANLKEKHYKLTQSQLQPAMRAAASSNWKRAGGSPALTDVAVLGDGPGVDLEDVEARLLVGQRNLDLSVEPAGPQQRRVQRVRTVGGHDHLHLRGRAGREVVSEREGVATRHILPAS